MKAIDIIANDRMDIIGLDQNLHVFAGYDEALRPANIGHDPRDLGEDPDESNTMNAAEKMVLADHMLARWQAYKQAAMAEAKPSLIGNPAHVMELVKVLNIKETSELLNKTPYWTDPKLNTLIDQEQIDATQKEIAMLNFPCFMHDTGKRSIFGHRILRDENGTEWSEDHFNIDLTEE